MKKLNRPLAVLALLVCAAGCQSLEPDFGPTVPDIEVRVLRLRPEKPLITLGHHSNRSYMDVAFSVLEPEEYRGRTLNLRFLPEYPGRLFECREFRLRIPRNVVEGKNRERKNSDGTTTVWSDLDTHWNFEAMMLEAVGAADKPPMPARGNAL